MSDLVIESVIKTNLIEYGNYISYNRAIPDVRDGLKPVQRRILWSSFELGLKPDRGHHKCAKVVGHTIGSYNPHGDQSCYESLVALATPWTIRYPLILGVGNFGSLKGHKPAAYRYTECGITELGFSHFLDKKYLNFIPNFDGKEKEPEVLSSLLPMILINGYSGISMGFSGSIPSHHILDVAKIALQHVKNLEKGIKEDFTDQLKGPQLESNCYCLSSKREIKELYETGLGTLTYCCDYHLDAKASKCIVTGFIPCVKCSTIEQDLSDLIEKDMVEVANFTSSSVQVEITMKDPRLFATRILPTLIKKESYQFHVVAPKKE